MNVFKILRKVPSFGIYCLINDKDKRVYVKHSNDIPMSIARVLGDIRAKKSVYKQLIKDVRRIRFLYLDPINIYDDVVSIHLKMDYHVRNFLEAGYTLYHSNYRLAKYKVAIEVSEDMERVFVKLNSRNHVKSIVVGVFEKMYEAEEFATIFDLMDIVKPVYSINKLTKDYILKHQK